MIRKAFARLLLVAWTCIAFGQWVSAQAVQVPEKFELYLFGGGSFYKALDDPSRLELVEGGIWGGSLTSNWGKFGLEISAASLVNNLRIVPANSSATTSLGARAFQASLDPVFHFTARNSRIRPYVSGGLGWTRFTTTTDARQSIADNPNPALRALSFDVNDELTFNYGGGIKFRLNNSGSFGLRVDMRGTISDQPTYGLPEGPSTGFTVATGTAYGFQPTAGLNFWFGKGAPPPPPPPTAPAPPPPPPPPPRNVVDVTEITMVGGNVEVCAGTPVGLSVTDTSKFPVRYQWTVNGTPTNGSTPSITITPGDAGGTQNVAVQLLDQTGAPNAAAPVTRTIAVRSRPYVRPTLQATAVGQSEVPRGGTATLSATAQGDCGGALTYTWAASEPGLTQTPGTPQQATFNTQGVGFGPATDREEIKQVNIVATVRDTRGGTASATVPLTIRKPAELVRLPDILFTSGSSRVNNCGKRILLEEVFPQNPVQQPYGCSGRTRRHFRNCGES